MDDALCIHVALKVTEHRPPNATTKQPALFAATHSFPRKTTVPSFAKIFYIIDK